MRRLILALLLWLAPLAAQAQNAANLIADRVEITADQRLIASGNVEVFFEGTKLSASRIIYSQASDRLVIEGPIFILGPDGTILTADRADLDPRLENGMLLGARMVLNQQLQLAANRIDRSGGRYTQLDRVAATSCSICGDDAPLWEIRARRVVHDQEARQLYFTDATFRVAGMPIFWVPQLRLPDPTLDRATGLLIPVLRSSDILGVGIKLPYFIRLGDSRDLTLTPYVSATTTTLEARYRQAYLRGDLELTGAVSNDQILPGAPRGYIFANGEFRLAHDVVLDFGLNVASDESYLLDYGYSTADRLETGFTLSRFREREAFWTDLTYYQGLQTTLTNNATPPLVAEARYEKLFYPDGLGGRLTVGGGIQGHIRTASDIDPDLTRDVVRLGADVDWTRRWIMPQGLIVEGNAGLIADAYATWDDPAYAPVISRAIPSARVTLSWPLVSTRSQGATNIVTPIMALGWRGVYGGTPANEDSTRVELHEANLFDLSYFPGEDAQVTGPQIALGGKWSRTGQSGWTTDLTFGRVLRRDAVTGFSASSGLSQTVSDWLLAAQFTFPSGLALDGRTLLDDSLTLSKSAARIRWNSEKLDLAASYVWLDADLAEDRPDNVSEWTFDSSYDINRTWGIGLGGRFDVVAKTPTEASASIRWRNECVEIELSASRRFTSSITVQPSTDFGLRFGLNGFSAGRSGVVSRQTCTN